MKSLLHLCLVLMTSTLIANPSTKVDFINGSLGLAIQKAGQEGKLLFVEFGAQWCMPCRFMDENTFKDGEVVSYLSDNYVPVKIDIDDFDGFVYKEKYKVKALPTFLIFNSEGKVIERYEQSMAPSNLLNILRQHNQEKHRRQVDTKLTAFEIEAKLHEQQGGRVNVSPYQSAEVPVEKEKGKITTSEEIAHTEAILDVDRPDQPIIESRFDDTPILEEIINEEDANLKDHVAVETTEELLWEDDEVYEMEKPSTSAYSDQVTTEATTLLETATPKIIFYTVRVGNFANKRSMDDYVKATSAVFVEDTHIFENKKDGISSFEVCLGAFATQSSATRFIDKLGFLNIRGDIKTVEQ